MIPQRQDSQCPSPYLGNLEFIWENCCCLFCEKPSSWTLTLAQHFRSSLTGFGDSTTKCTNQFPTHNQTYTQTSTIQLMAGAQAWESLGTDRRGSGVKPKIHLRCSAHLTCVKCRPQHQQEESHCSAIEIMFRKQQINQHSWQATITLYHLFSDIYGPDAHDPLFVL